MTTLPPPLVLALLALLAGLLPALRFAPDPRLPLVLAAAALLGAVLAPRLAIHRTERLQAALLLLCFAATGAALGAWGARDAAADCRARVADGKRVEVQGVLGAGLRAGGGEGRIYLPLEVAEWSGAGCEETVRVRVPAASGVEAAAGSTVRVRGEWVRQGGPVVATAWPRDPLYAGFLTADSIMVIEGPRLLAHPLLTARGRVEELLRDLFPRHDALAQALLLGRRERMDPAVRDRFARSGLAHLLAISGMHVALLAGALLLVGAAARLPRRRMAVLTIVGTWTYLAVIGAPPSAVRAGVMLSLALLAVLLQRPSAALPIVAAAALVILALDPLAALDPGFQLSFAGVLGILLARRAVLPQVPVAWRRNALARAGVETLVISAAAFVATAPITAYFFGQVAPVAVVANLPAIPLSSLALVGVVLAAVLGPVVPPLARVVADGAGVALDALDRVASFAAELPYGHLAVSRPQVWGWLAAAVVLLLALDAARHLRPRARGVVGVGSAAALLLAWPALVRGSSGALEVHFLDVGQGDAIALHTPAGRWVLVDAGPKLRDYDAGARRVLPFLRAHGARRLDALILTHPDADHVGGAPAVLAGIPVDRVIDPGLPVGKELYVELLDRVDSVGTTWSAARAGSVLRLDGIRLEFLWPAGNSLDAAEEANQISAVVRLRFGDFAMLLTGDAPAEVEQHLAATRADDLRAHVLKAGHHGSSTSTSAALLDAVKPQLVVISAGRRNRYGHPAPEVLERLRRRGIPIARTDREGTITLRVLPDGGQLWTRVEP